MLKFRNLILIFCAIAMLLLCFCHDHGERFEENPFPDYQVYDYHLRYLRTEKEFGKWRSEGYFFWYYQIDGIDESQCVGRQGGPTIGTPDAYVLQCSQNPIDILREWTVTSIEFFIPPTGTGTRFYRQRFGKLVNYMEPHYQADDQSAYEELLLLINAPKKIRSNSIDEYGEELLEQYWVTEKDMEFFDVLRTGKLYMRINFAETDAIAWETDFLIHEEPDGKIYLSMDFGTSMANYFPSYKHCLIARDSAIYRAVIAALEAYAAQ